MKKMLGLVMVLGLVLVLGRVAMAGDTNTVTVTANVVGTCKFNSGTSTLAFGELPFDAAGNALGDTASTSVTFWCTKGASYSITDDDGLYEAAAGNQSMKHGTLAEYIAYNFSYNPTSGTGAGRTTNVTLNINGTVAGLAYQDASAGSYEDTVLLTIAP
jgi:spore coat protein U-like protein